jgi:hypothetical protein
MAVYKVIQDIEAEDKLLGPLSLKGLIYAFIAGACAFLDVRLIQVSALGPAKWLIIILFLFPIILFGVLASPLGRDQPTEVWLLARMRFFLKPRQRIWDQAGIQELVTITVPKKIARQLTKNFTESEVDSRLEALATTLDSRGWAVKNVNVNLTKTPGYFDQQDESDRLIATAELVQEVPEVNIHAADDILDAAANPTAQNFQTLMNQAEVQRKQALVDRLNNAKSEDAKQEEQFESEHGMHNEKIHDLRPVYEVHQTTGTKKAPEKQPTPPANVPANTVTALPQAAKLELSNAGNDLSVASIAKLANRGGSGEVVINLH